MTLNLKIVNTAQKGTGEERMKPEKKVRNLYVPCLQERGDPAVQQLRQTGEYSPDPVREGDRGDCVEG